MFDSFLKLIGNYIFVQACLVLFALPFYLLYRRKHIKAENKDFGFNWHMENFFSSRYANWLVFCHRAGTFVYRKVCGGAQGPLGEGMIGQRRNASTVPPSKKATELP